MDNLKSYVPIILSLCLSAVLIFILGISNSKDEIHLAKTIYNVYLDGKLIGSINSEKELENYIDKEQKKLKKQYGVKKVYIPTGIDIQKKVTHNAKTVPVKKIYQKIKAKKGFNIKGYIVTISDGKEEIKLNLLKKNHFNEAVNKVVKSFVNTNDIKNYRNDTQPEIKTTGSKIENIEIEQNISIKESFISTEDQIYPDVDSLSKYLLFGSSDTNKEYTVKPGDTIETVSFNNKLSTEEFLIVNPEFTSSKNLLSAGQKVNIALISPVLKIVVEKHVVQDVNKPYDTIEKEDSNLASGTTKVETEGINGVQRVTQKVKYINGETSRTVIVGSEVIKEATNRVVLKGTKKSYTPNIDYYNGSGTHVETAGAWGWPTVSPYVIESTFKYRWGRLHAGIDITAGFGSPIYAARDGVVTGLVASCSNVGSYGSSCGGGYGNYIIINHGDGMQSIYGHMTNAHRVSVGQTVKRGQIIGTMGGSGSSTGTHLHYGIYYGTPMRGGSPINPLSLY